MIEVSTKQIDKSTIFARTPNIVLTYEVHVLRLYFMLERLKEYVGRRTKVIMFYL